MFTGSWLKVLDAESWNIPLMRGMKGLFLGNEGICDLKAMYVSVLQGEYFWGLSIIDNYSIIFLAFKRFAN